MVSQPKNSASLVVGLIFVTEMIDNWRAVNQSCLQRRLDVTAQAHMLTHDAKMNYAPSRLGGKNVKISIFNSILNMGPRFKYLP